MPPASPPLIDKANTDIPSSSFETAIMKLVVIYADDNVASMAATLIGGFYNIILYLVVVLLIV